MASPEPISIPTRTSQTPSPPSLQQPREGYQQQQTPTPSQPPSLLPAHGSSLSSSTSSECIIVRDCDSSSVVTVETGITSIMSSSGNSGVGSKAGSRAATPEVEMDLGMDLEMEVDEVDGEGDGKDEAVVEAQTPITRAMKAMKSKSKSKSVVVSTLTPDTEGEARANSSLFTPKSGNKGHGGSQQQQSQQQPKTPLTATRVLRQRPSRPELAPKSPKSATKKSVVKSEATAGAKQVSPQLSDVIQIRSVSETINVKDEANVVRRRSTRISLLPTEVKPAAAPQPPPKPKAVATMETPKRKDTVVGKRSHEVMKAGSRSANAKLGSSTWGSGSKSSARVTKKAKVVQAPVVDSSSEEEESEEESEEEEDSEEEEEEEEEEPEVKVQPKRVKKWATHGLYMGQEDGFDPRRRTKRGRLSGAGVVPPKRKPIMPLPMFHGLDILNTQRDFKLPFNLFSPSMQKIHPPGWKILSRNIFVGDAREQWKSESEPTGKCVCKIETGCDENCINRCVYYECNNENCNVGPEYCHNRHFAALKKRVLRKSKFADGVEVILTKDRGYGLRAIRSFEPNQIIVEYCGEIISQEETDERMRKVYKNNSSYYLMLFDQSMIIDATRGSIARFVNHSCDPNCRMEKWIVDNKPRMALFAGENGIETGEELTYDYNFNWFSGVSQQICRCGAESCRGAMGKRSDGRKTIVEEKPVKVIKKKKANRIQASITVGAEKKSSSGGKGSKSAKGGKESKATVQPTKATKTTAVTTKSTKTAKTTKASSSPIKPSKSSTTTTTTAAVAKSSKSTTAKSTTAAAKVRVFKVVKKTTVKKVINQKVVKKTVVKTPVTSSAATSAPKPLAPVKSLTLGKTSVGYQRRVGKTYGRVKTYAGGANRTIKPDDEDVKGVSTVTAAAAGGVENMGVKVVGGASGNGKGKGAGSGRGEVGVVPVPQQGNQRPKRTAYGTIQNLARGMSEKTGLQGPVLDTIVLVR